MQNGHDRDTALIVVDVQNDFCPGGALGGSGRPRNRGADQRADRALRQRRADAGLASSRSFELCLQPCRQRRRFSSVEMSYGPQTLWPDHCIQGSPGAEFHRDLAWTKAQLVVRKGFTGAIDSYSAFFENDRRTPTGLAGYLRERGIGKIVLAGLATDYCVHYSALDAARLRLQDKRPDGASAPSTSTARCGEAERGMRAAGVSR